MVRSSVIEEFYPRRRVLITGGAGFIGSNLAHELVRLGAEVTIVDSLIPEYGGNLRNLHGIESKVRVNLADVRDRHVLPVLLRGQDVLFNLAGQSSHLDSIHDPETDLEINCRAQLSILEACRKHNPGIGVVFASTRQIYGKPDYLPVDEKHPVRPVDVNGINKAAGERYHTLYHEVHGLRTCVLRLTNTIGPRMRVKDARQTFLGVWVRRVLENQSIEVWGGAQVRDFTYVDDCVQALLLAGAHPAAAGQVFNLGGTERVALEPLARLLVGIAAQGSVDVKPFPAERRKIDIGDYYADDASIRATLGWSAEVKLRDALERTVKFFRAELANYV